MDLAAYVGAIVEGRFTEAGVPPPLLDRVAHLIAARAAWARAPSGAASTSGQLACALGLVVEIAPLPPGIPFAMADRGVLCSSTEGGQVRGLRTFAAVAFVVLRGGTAFNVSDVWLVAHQLATHGAAWAGPPSLLTPPG